MKNYSAAELRAMPAIQVGPDHLRNPFASVSDTKEGIELSRRWAHIHWPEVFEDSNADDSDIDPFDLLRASLDTQRLWHKAEGPQASAFFPVQARDVAAWEARSEKMHAAQDVSGAVPEPKPLEPGIRSKRTVVRGD